MTSHVVLPPHHHHIVKCISPARALSLLSTYLESAAIEPSHHPNALLTAGGPTTPATDVGNVGLVLHNLKRVQASLRGEQLGANLTFGKYGGQGLPRLMHTQDGFVNILSKDGTEVAGDTNGGEELWQDRTEFDRQQEIVQGEIGERDNAARKRHDALTVPRVEATKTIADKDVRKKRKKERRQQERKEAEIKKQRMKD